MDKYVATPPIIKGSGTFYAKLDVKKKKKNQDWILFPCIVLYIDSCERTYCMFKHGKKKESEESDIIEIGNYIVIENNSEETEDSNSIHVVEV